MMHIENTIKDMEKLLERIAFFRESLEEDTFRRLIGGLNWGIMELTELDNQYSDFIAVQSESLHYVFTDDFGNQWLKNPFQCELTHVLI